MKKYVPRKEGRSMSPVGVTTTTARERLQYPDPYDPEKIMARIWARENTPKRWLNFGQIPLDLITHRCTKKCTRDEKGITHHVFSGKIVDRDRRVAAATAQWLATNGGRDLQQQFFRELEAAWKARRMERRLMNRAEARDAKQGQSC